MIPVRRGASIFTGHCTGLKNPMGIVHHPNKRRPRNFSGPTRVMSFILSIAKRPIPLHITYLKSDGAFKTKMTKTGGSILH